MGPLLWSQDGPRSLEETAEGSRAATPRTQPLPPQHGDGDTVPSLPGRSRPQRYREPVSPSTPSRLAMMSTHLESAEARGRGTGKSGALLWVRVGGWRGCRGS